jgi:Ca2+-binding EF-hand superfamily protein
MINRLGIKMNMGEAQVLVACSDKTGSGTLNLHDFIRMILDGDDAVEID